MNKDVKEKAAGGKPAAWVVIDAANNVLTCIYYTTKGFPVQALRPLPIRLIYALETVLYRLWLALNDRPLALLEASP